MKKELTVFKRLNRTDSEGARYAFNLAARNPGEDLARSSNSFADFPFESHYVQVSRNRIHYIEEGTGRPVLFIHGNHASSYQWRNIIPIVSKAGRCVALDLLGFGKSDKPDIDYTFDDHAAVVDGFIRGMRLKKMVMVVSDWGAAFGFWHAIHHPEDVAGIAAYEAVILPRTWDDYKGERRKKFEMLRDRRFNYDMVQARNSIVETLPERVLYKERLTKEVMDSYRAPFPTPESRKAMRRFPEMLPIGEESETYREFKEIEDGLPSLRVPVLLMTATPGTAMTERQVGILRERIRDFEIRNVGPGLHDLHEDQPEAIGRAVVDWMKARGL
jgi:haloalkane dehalogenase